MKLGWIVGMSSAVLAHAVVIAFGGIFFLDDDKDEASLQTVDLLSELDAEQEKKDEEQPKEEVAAEDELETETEEPPDSADIVRSLDTPATFDDAPALEAVSLSAIEAALNGQSGGGDFAEALSFSSGGRIGGTGKAGALAETADDAFSLAELDQKPRAIFQSSPVIPAQMRGKKTEGLVSVIFVVDAEGKVVGPRAEKSSHAAFETPALDAVKKWKFEPGVRGGQRVATKMRISIRFPPS
jgi:TonB family protein